ncbi:hypothetical protein PORCRE_505 [Porphyromonas crevioricanis JCM 15906]|uniref:Uncharacterized protein n=1 Tax=Porphyromonas crevioricanis JCM 15906 TaxID=1305617 RepID=T1DRE4_9PORP|nr:hypothetical protein PORCRE_505 [Porphyromonas crevioricanis JCM 15906]
MSILLPLSLLFGGLFYRKGTSTKRARAKIDEYSEPTPL